MCRESVWYERSVRWRVKGYSEWWCENVNVVVVAERRRVYEM